MRRLERSSRVLPARHLGARPWAPRTALALVAGLTGCTGSSHSHVGPPPAPPSIPVYAESEPNDDPWLPLVVDELVVGTTLEFHGSVETSPGWDVIDHFAFRAVEPMEVRFTLIGASSFDDLDLSVWDEFLGEYVDSWTSPFDPEHGSFLVTSFWGEFSLAVWAPLADADYSLVVQALPCPYGPQAVGGDGGDGPGGLAPTGDVRAADGLATLGAGASSGSSSETSILRRLDPREDDVHPLDPERIAVLRSVPVGVRGDAGREPVTRVHPPRTEPH